MPRNFVYYDAFVKGETGLHSSWLDGYRLFRGILIYTGTWHGNNIMRYIDGTVGPRPGLWKVPVTGLSNGTLVGYGTTDTLAADGWFIQSGSTAVVGFDHQGGGAAFTYTGALSAAPTSPVAWVKHFGGVFISSKGDGTYFLDAVAKTCTKVTNAPGGRVIAKYMDRLVVGDLGGANPNNQIQWSDIFTPGNAAPQQFPFPASANFLNIGDGYQVTAMLPQRTHLAIAKQNVWYVLTGTLGTSTAIGTSVLRQAIGGGGGGIANDGPIEAASADVLASGLIHFVPLFVDCPATFSGSQLGEARNLRFANGAGPTSNHLLPYFGVSRMPQPNDVFYLSTAANSGAPNLAAVQHNGAWSYLTFGVNTNLPAFGTENGVYMTDGGSGGAVPQFFVWNSELDRPVVSGDNHAMPGDNSSTHLTCNFDLPEWESRDGSEVVVRAVLVDFNKWNHGNAYTNHFDVTVKSASQWNKAGAQSSVTQSFDEAASATPSNPTRHRKVFFEGGQSTGNGFQISFANLRGVAIAKVQVIVDIQQPRV